jgi:hypothetical protein
MHLATEDDHIMPGLYQPGNKIGPDMPGAADEDNAHFTPLLFDALLPLERSSHLWVILFRIVGGAPG